MRQARSILTRQNLPFKLAGVHASPGVSSVRSGGARPRWASFGFPRPRWAVANDEMRRESRSFIVSWSDCRSNRLSKVKELQVEEILRFMSHCCCVGGGWGLQKGEPIPSIPVLYSRALAWRHWHVLTALYHIPVCSRVFPQRSKICKNYMRHETSALGGIGTCCSIPRRYLFPCWPGGIGTC